MKQAISLSVSGRDLKKNVKKMRKTGIVPGIIYGNAANTAVEFSGKEFHNVFSQAGENTLVEVQIDGKAIPCLVHAVSYEPKTGAYDHIDFYAVDMTKKVTTHVPIVVEGESPAVKNEGGVLLTVHSQLEVTCLPTDLPSHFVVNLAKLEKLHSSFTVADLQIPKGVEITEAPATAIVIVQEPRKEEVIEVVTTAVPAEGALPADGAAPAAPGGAAPGATGTAPAKGVTPAKGGAPAGAPAKK